MSSFTPISDITPRSRALSASLNDLNDNVSAAFSVLPDETKLSAGTATSGTDTGVADAYVVSLPIAPSVYIANLHVVFTPANSNTGPSTIDVNGLGVVHIKHSDGTGLLGANDIVAGVPVSLRYSAVTGAFHISQSPFSSAASASASAAAAAASAAAAAASASSAAESALSMVTFSDVLIMTGDIIAGYTSGYKRVLFWDPGGADRNLYFSNVFPGGYEMVLINTGEELIIFDPDGLNRAVGPGQKVSFYYDGTNWF